MPRDSKRPLQKAFASGARERGAKKCEKTILIKTTKSSIKLKRRERDPIKITGGSETNGVVEKQIRVAESTKGGGKRGK